MSTCSGSRIIPGMPEAGAILPDGTVLGFDVG
ncbi:Holliday junction resolvase RuvX, partial [Xanthomonas oryzae pv. oryzae]